MSTTAVDASETRDEVNSYITDVNEVFQSIGLSDDDFAIDYFDTVDTYESYEDFKRVWKVIDGQMMSAAETLSEYIESADPDELHPNAPHAHEILQYRLSDEMGNLDSEMKPLFPEA